MAYEKKSAINCARNFVLSFIQGKDTGKLPTLQTFADSAKVSRKTMWKAIGMLCREGLLSVKQGSGIYIGPVPFAQPSQITALPNTTAHCQWERVKRSILSDILCGFLRFKDMLPAQKALALHYAVDSRTLRKSLASLVSENIVKRERTGYRIVRPAILSASQSTIILLLPQNLNTLMQWSYYTHGMQGFSTLLERECSHRGIALIRRTYEQAIHEINLLRDALGIICWIGGNEDEAATFFKALPSMKQPIGIVNYFSQFVIPPECAATLNILTLSSDQRNSMYLMGQYAIQLGHRKFGYFRCSDSPGWPETRLAGVRDAFQSANITLDNLIIFDSRPSRLPSFANQSPSGIFDTLKAYIYENVENETLKKMLDMRMYEADQYAQFGFYARGSFTEALERPEITAWICESQSLAVFGALPFLKARKISVPQRLSVMAQGDAPEAFSAGLTSTALRMDLCLEEIMRHILYAKVEKLPYRKEQAIPNMIAVRETSAAAAAIFQMYK